ncbi:phage head closure protein [Belliella sp. DSM 111904]|uniref:Phage head closure protein n=1 Tax=Belliella filtrata TaxID=2923435 RepID=A0ABS9V409_9BACT|nr:phage head closure protein [Belliella filtrata]MCH7411157.1 phage head closure protein [Belliella filtrata]
MLKIEQESTTKNTYGEEVIEWVEFESVFAEKYDKVNKESFQANQLTAIVSTVFTIYFIEGLTEKMRLVDIDTDTIYQIEGIKEIGYKEGLQLITYTKDRF